MKIKINEAVCKKCSYETSDGISRSEEAEVKNQGTENETLVVRGTVSWVAPDGVRYTISFVSDENGEKEVLWEEGWFKYFYFLGFQPTGDHLPK